MPAGCRGVDTQESKHGGGAVTVMEHMLKSAGRGDGARRDKASALRTDPSCVSRSSSDNFNLFTYGIINPQLPAGGVYSSRFLGTKRWLRGQKILQSQSKYYILTKCCWSFGSLCSDSPLLSGILRSNMFKLWQNMETFIKSSVQAVQNVIRTIFRHKQARKDTHFVFIDCRKQSTINN